MRIELLYFDDCPNWRLADGRLAEALQTLGRDGVAVERRLIETAEQATAVGFAGSPTTLVDGVDPFAPGRAGVGLAFRLYATPGGLRGCPDPAQILEALS